MQHGSGCLEGCRRLGRSWRQAAQGCSYGARSCAAADSRQRGSMGARAAAAVGQQISSCSSLLSPPPPPAGSLGATAAPQPLLSPAR